MISLGQLVIILSAIFAAVGWAFTHLEQIEILLGWLLRIFSWIHRRVKLKAINTQIQAKINVAVEAIESEVEGVMPHPIKIEWLKRGEEQAAIEDNEVVVRLRINFDDARNVVTATMLYLQTGFLRQSRPHTNHSLQKALDLEMAWKLLGTDEETNVGHYFLNKVYNPLILDDDQIEFCSKKIRRLDSGGVLTRILLRELRGLGRKVSGNLPDRETREETKLFLDFLHTIEISERGAIYPLNFLGKSIRAGVLLVASYETLAMKGLRAHKWWLKKKVRMGVETVYVRAIGLENVDLARHIAQWGQQEGLVEIVRSQTYTMPTRSGRPNRAVLITCHSTQTRTDIILSPEEEVQAALVRHVPEIASGQVEIIDIVREVGVQTKVILRSASDSIDDPVRICNGKESQMLVNIINDIQESIWFIRWSDDIKQFVVDCLGIPPDKIRSIDIDPKKRSAKIVVYDKTTAARAVGTKGSNVRLTSKITGIDVTILTVGELDESLIPTIALNPEDELREKILKQIPEIADGDIEIVDLVREPGIQSKVVVRSTADDIDAIKVCLGKNNCHIDTLRDNLQENIRFVKWVEDINIFLINCLGLSRYRVRNVQIDRLQNTATVVVKDKRSAAMAVGENGINVKQATQLTGFRHIDIYNAEDFQ